MAPHGIDPQLAVSRWSWWWTDAASSRHPAAEFDQPRSTPASTQSAADVGGVGGAVDQVGEQVVVEGGIGALETDPRAVLA